MIHIDKKHYAIVTSILKQSPVSFYAFGSRVRGTHKKFSDLDLCYKGEIPSSILNKIEEDFAESDLPFKVDIVDFNRCSEEFRNLIEREMVAL